MHAPILVALLAGSTLLVQAVAQRPQDPNSTRFVLSRGQITVEAQQGQTARVRRADADLPGQFAMRPGPGQPDLPLVAVDVLLPFDVDMQSLRIAVQPGATQSLGGAQLAPVPRGESYDLDNQTTMLEDIGGRTLDQAGRDVQTYSQNSFWPQFQVRPIAAGKLRQHRWVRLAYAPVQWQPHTGELRAQDLTVVVSWAKAAVADAVVFEALTDPVQLDLTDRFVNLKNLAGWYTWGSGWRRATTCDYLIITSSATISASTELDAFVAHKESQGFTVLVASVESIEAVYGVAGGERADAIRAFLCDKHAEWGVRYLLLIGNPDPHDSWVAGDAVGDVPMKMAWPRGDGLESRADGDACPTDLYYGDLSSTWDVDGDGYVAAYDDDYVTHSSHVSSGGHDYTLTWREYGVDFDQEVLVSRVPFDTVSDIDAVLAATVNYQTATMTSSLVTARKRVYLAMSDFSDDTDMSYLGHQIQMSDSHPAGLTTWSFYERQDYYDGTAYLENEALINRWTAQGAGLVAWTGHGSWSGANIRYDDTDLMNYADIPSFNSYPRAFVVQGSCRNAEPEYANCVSHRLLRYCAVGCVGGTRNSWFDSGRTSYGSDCKIGDLVYEVTANLIGGSSIGSSLSKFRSTSAADSSTDFQNLMTYNAYGDPHGRYDF